MALKRTILILATVAVSAALLVTACGQATPTPEAPTEEGTGPAAPVETESAAPEENIGVFGYYESPTELDPSATFDATNTITANLYETLTFYNNPGSDQLIGPRLATSWEKNEDGTIWTFHLRQGVTFHDGTPFNAEAVRFSFDRSSQPDFPVSYIFDPINRMEVVDNYTIRFYCDYPAPLDLIFASAYGAWIMSPTTVADKDSAWFNEGHEAGTGPYYIESYEPGQRLVLASYPEYWGGWEPGQFTRVIYEVIEDPSTREQMLRAGEIDISTNLTVENIPDLMQQPDLVVDNAPAFVNLFAHMNERRPPLDNPLVRQALIYSFPYEAVVQNVYLGLATPASGAIPANMWGHNPNLAVQQDKARAAELLAEAGYPGGGFELRFWVWEGIPVFQQIGEIWAPELAELGITLQIQVMNGAAIYDIADNNPEEAHDILALRWWPTYVTPYDWLYSQFYTDGYGNYSYYSNPTFDALVDEANIMTGTDVEEAGRMFAEAQQILADDAVAIFVMDLPYTTVFRSDITGYHYYPGYTAVVFWYDLRR